MLGGILRKKAVRRCQPNRLFQHFGFSSKIHELRRLNSLEWRKRDFSDDADACYAGPVIDDDDDDDDNDKNGGDYDDNDDDNDDDYKCGDYDDDDDDDDDYNGGDYDDDNDDDDNDYKSGKR